MKKGKILYIEDDLTLGDLFLEVFAKAGLEVIWFVRVRLDADDIVVMDVDGKQQKLMADDYALALVDGRLKGSLVDGYDLCPLLVKRGLPVVACSGDPGLNKQMIASGAAGSIEKLDILARVMDGNLSFLTQKARASLL